jgi:hypothetical protein
MGLYREETFVSLRHGATLEGQLTQLLPPAADRRRRVRQNLDRAGAAVFVDLGLSRFYESVSAKTGGCQAAYFKPKKA